MLCITTALIAVKETARLLDVKDLVEKQMQSKWKQAMLTLPFKDRRDEAYITPCWA